MESRVFLENKESLAEYLVGLKQNFSIKVNSNNVIYRNGEGSRYKSILKNCEGRVKPVIQILVKNDSNDIIKILIPEYVIKTSMYYANSSSIVCDFEFTIPQKLIKFEMSLEDNAKDFDIAEDIINDKIQNEIIANVNDLFYNVFSDKTGKWTLEGDVEYDTILSYYVG